MPHIAAAILLVVAINILVIIGITGSISFLLIPWLICYGVGELFS